MTQAEVLAEMGMRGVSWGQAPNLTLINLLLERSYQKLNDYSWPIRRNLQMSLLKELFLKLLKF